MIFSHNATTKHKQSVGSIFDIPHKDSVGKYLRCPVFQGKPETSTISKILAKATGRMESWKANSILEARRTVLIQSNLESLPAHTI